MLSTFLLKKLFVPVVLSSVAVTGLTGCGLRRCSRQPSQPQGQPETTKERSVQSEAEIEEVFKNHNIYAVYNRPTNPTTFTLDESRHIYSIENYHWNNSQGKSPETISLEAEDGTVYGPWQATGRPGQGGVPDAYWTCYPDTQIPAGTYTIIDSDPDTWSHNPESGGSGASRVNALK